MSFSIRPYRRVPVCCPVTYHAGLSEGYGTVWNFSLTGWRFSGDVPMQPGETRSLNVKLPNEPSMEVLEAVVRWTRHQEYAVETPTMNPHTRTRLRNYLNQLVREATEIIL